LAQTACGPMIAVNEQMGLYLVSLRSQVREVGDDARDGRINVIDVPVVDQAMAHTGADAVLFKLDRLATVAHQGAGTVHVKDISGIQVVVDFPAVTTAARALRCHRGLDRRHDRPSSPNCSGPLTLSLRLKPSSRKRRASNFGRL